MRLDACCAVRLWRPKLLRFSSILGVVSLLTLIVVLQSTGRKAEHQLDPALLQVAPTFQRTWSRTDRPVAEDVVSRTWMWGPAPVTDELSEVYVNSPVGQRRIVYYDKSRMEITDPATDEQAAWYVTNGLLVVEMVTGKLQVGDETFRDVASSTVNIAGDSDDPDGPTYASIGGLLATVPLAEDEPIIQRLDRSGTVRNDQSLAARGVRAAQLVPETGHRIAGPFWDFMNSSGSIWNGTEYSNASLFPNPFFATGFPVAEAYWAEVRVAGERQDVLLQCFERRCLTYTPGNDSGWQVESGNVGLHYYEWRYNQIAFSDPEPYPEALDDLPLAPVVSGDGAGNQLYLEVVTTNDSRSCGLMHRRGMLENHGMLFVFDAPRGGGFWNCNTFIPLTLAWLDAEGTILELTDMAAATPGEPQNPISYTPSGVYRYVIEANQGWFQQHGVGVGDRLDLSGPLGAGQTSPIHICNQLGFECQ